MEDFWKRGFDFLFRQSPAIVFMALASVLMWQKVERVELAAVIERVEIKREFSGIIADVRQELKECAIAKEQLAIRVAALETGAGRKNR